MSEKDLHSLKLPRNAGKLEPYLMRPELLQYRNTSGKIVPAILHAISRQDIEAGRVHRLANIFPLEIARDELRENVGRFIFAPMDYGSDEGELYLNPSVRDFIQGVTALRPHWLFSSCFFFPSAVVIALCCMKNLTVCQSGDRVEVTYDLGEMEEFFCSCLETTATLDVRAGISRQESVQRLGLVRRTLGLPC